MGAPVYKIGERFVRLCYDGWMYEIPNATAHNYEGRCLTPREGGKVTEAIRDGSAIETK